MGKSGALALAMGAFLFFASPADAQHAGEFALPGADSSFVLAWSEVNGAETHEYIPRGETVEAWTRMVTVQRMPWRIGLTPRAILARLSQMMVAACPGATATEIAGAPSHDRDGAGVRVTCPKSPSTGKPEIMNARAIQGDESIALVQAAVRRTPSAADVAWAASVLDGVTLCSAGAATPRCVVARTAKPGSPL